jgi:hypothetical protein
MGVGMNRHGGAAHKKKKIKKILEKEMRGHTIF